MVKLLFITHYLVNYSTTLRDDHQFCGPGLTNIMRANAPVALLFNFLNELTPNSPTMIPSLHLWIGNSKPQLLHLCRPLLRRLIIHHSLSEWWYYNNAPIWKLLIFGKFPKIWVEKIAREEDDQSLFLTFLTRLIKRILLIIAITCANRDYLIQLYYMIEEKDSRIDSIDDEGEKSSSETNQGRRPIVWQDYFEEGRRPTVWRVARRSVHRLVFYLFIWLLFRFTCTSWEGRRIRGTVRDRRCQFCRKTILIVLLWCNYHSEFNNYRRVIFSPTNYFYSLSRFFSRRKIIVWIWITK